MKIKHVIARAIKAPDTTKVYGAKVEGVELQNGALVFTWAIFARKPHSKKRKPRTQAAAAKEAV